MLSSRLLKIAFLGLTLSVAGCSRESSDAAQPAASSGSSTQAGVIDRSHKGNRMPDLSFRDAAGHTLQLTSLRGKPVLLNLWATWCAPCKAEMPALDRLGAAQGHRLKVITISQDMAKLEKVAGFFRERQIAWLDPWLDPDNTLSSHYQVNVLPTTIFYDSAGQEVWRFIGPRDWGNAETAALLAEAR